MTALLKHSFLRGSFIPGIAPAGKRAHRRPQSQCEPLECRRLLSGSPCSTAHGTSVSNGTVSTLSQGAVTIGPATQLVFSAPIDGAVAGVAITPTVVVDVEDANGNIVTTDHSTVSLGLLYGTEGALFGGPTSAVAVNGVASFPGLSINTAGTGYAMSASDGSLFMAFSSVFTVSPNGSGGGGTGLTPVILGTKVQASVVGGVKLPHSSITVSIENQTTAAETGYTVNVYASAGTTLDTSTDTLVTSVAKPTATIKPNKASKLTIPITSLPASLPTGAYYLTVEVVDSAGNTGSTTGAAVSVEAPSVALSETVASTLPATLVSGTSAHGKVTVTITNGGNVPSNGSTMIDLTASTVAGVAGTSILPEPLSKKLNIPPGRSAKVVLNIKSTPALTDGTDFIVAEVTDPFAFATTVGTSTSTIAVSAPVITLGATLGPVKKVKSGDTLTLTNSGNVDDVSPFMVTFGFSSDPAGQLPVGQTASTTTGTLHVRFGKSIKLHSSAWSKILDGLAAGVPYYLTMTVTDESGNSASAVSSTTFTL